MKLIIVLRKKGCFSSTKYTNHEIHEKREIFVIFVYFVEEYNQSCLRHDALLTILRIQFIHELLASFRDVPRIGPEAEVDFPPIVFVIGFV